MQIDTVEMFLADWTVAMLVPPQSHAFLAVLVTTNLLHMSRVSNDHRIGERLPVPLKPQLQKTVDR